MIEPGLETAWSVLSSAKADRETVQILAVGSAVSAGAVLAGLDYEGRRSLMVPLFPGEAFVEDRSGHAVHLERATHKGQHYLVAKCLDPGLNDVFSIFAEELIQELSPTSPGCQTVVDMLFDWRLLFSTAIERVPLSTSQQIGLLAELLVLVNIVAIAPQVALECWTGPEGSQHDFRQGNQALEVKASRTREGRRHSISSVHQLSVPKGWSLTLASFKFEKREDGTSIQDAVNKLTSLGLPKVPLEKKLISCGINPQDLHIYSDRWATLENRLYDVTEPSFPKIVPDSFVCGHVPAGTSNVSYTIDLSNEPPMPLGEIERHDVYSRMAGAA